MSIETLLIILLIGATAGWLAGQIVQGTGFGLIADIVIGIIGAFIGNWLLTLAGHRPWRRHRRCHYRRHDRRGRAFSSSQFLRKKWGYAFPKRWRRWRRALPSHVADGSYFYYFVGACWRTAGTLRRH